MNTQKSLFVDHFNVWRTCNEKEEKWVLFNLATVETTLWFWLCSIEHAWIASVYRIRRRKWCFPLNLQYRSAPLRTACTFPLLKLSYMALRAIFAREIVCNDTRTGTHPHIISSVWLYLAAHASRTNNRRTGKKQAVKTSSAAITTPFN